jgi:hypothetical protein
MYVLCMYVRFMYVCMQTLEYGVRGVQEKDCCTRERVCAYVCMDVYVCVYVCVHPNMYTNMLM